MRLQVIDSHTGGEPTRMVLEDQIDLRGATMAQRRDDFSRRFDDLRSGIVNEPRGSEVWVGALLTAPVEEGSIAGVIFFNNTGTLGMCGHGTIGVVQSLAHLGRITPGTIRLDTPVGTVTATLHSNQEVEIQNVVSYRFWVDVPLEVPGVGTIKGDIAYGGNWFFIVREPEYDITLANADQLTAITQAIKATLVRERITGADFAEIDHIELLGPSEAADSRNFVLCPGGAYDRSPCGTGTSAKLACLYADGTLAAGEEYRQESITLSVFRGSVQPVEGGVRPTIIGRAYVTAESTLIFHEQDPLRHGLAT